MELMQPIATSHIEPSSEWVYEVKYDGFRATLLWTSNHIKIISRNNKELTENFPEIISFCQKSQSKVASMLPIQLDGELVILNNHFQANFAAIQKRGRLKTKEKIVEAAQKRPATMMIFDLIEINGEKIEQQPLTKRKEQLQNFIEKVEQTKDRLQFVDTYKKHEEISQIAFDYKAEGIVAKRNQSSYTAGKKHHDWL